MKVIHLSQQTVTSSVKILFYVKHYLRRLPCQASVVRTHDVKKVDCEWNEQLIELATKSPSYE